MKSEPEQELTADAASAALSSFVSARLKPSRPICETWSDHEWGEPHLAGSGTHPVRGAYHTVRTRCARCEKTRTETVWLKMPGSLEARPCGD